jgi:c(7)-type cytochrome triheme protein
MPLRRRLLRLTWLALIAGTAWAAPQAARKWLPLAQDGIHDPLSPAIGVLQEPAEALAVLPPDTAGNQVHWVRAIEGKYIAPRAGVGGGQLEQRDTDVMRGNTGEMAMVKFPHRPHTLWLACSNCHDALFEQRAGATRINMAMILRGEKCGVCHGAVAFPLTECTRCHNTPRQLGPVLRAPG